VEEEPCIPASASQTDQVHEKELHSKARDPRLTFL